MNSSALFSADRRYRYWLLREWDRSLPLICFILLNPSIADEKANDQTVVKLIAYTQQWHYGGFLLLNLYSYCATDPRELWRAHKFGRDIVGGPQGFFLSLKEYADRFKVERTIAGWGKDRTERHGLFERSAWNLDCLRKNKDGSPHHPLYLPINVNPQPWNYTVDAEMRKVPNDSRPPSLRS